MPLPLRSKWTFERPGAELNALPSKSKRFNVAILVAMRGIPDIAWKLGFGRK